MPLTGPIFLAAFVIFMSIQTFQKEAQAKEEEVKKAKTEQTKESDKALSAALKQTLADVLQSSS